MHDYAGIVQGRFLGQTALVTGGASGIGKALRLARESASVRVLDVNQRSLDNISIRPDMHRSLVIDALEMGLFQRLPPKGQMIFHSDRGSQYASDDFRGVLDRHGVQPSRSRKGNCWDNAVTETLFGSLKVERLHGERFQIIRQAKDAVVAWLLWYNRQRMHSTLNYFSPVSLC